MDYREIVLGGGCFWCIEAVFERIKGVINTEVGYSGGADNPTYESVCNGDQNIEVVKIVYDKNQISLEKILIIFFNIHDPTSKDKQGADEGIQYRSAIFYQDDEDFKIITQFLQNAQKNYTKTILTQVLKLKKFYKAEDYHQKYFTKNPNQTYCQFVITPKVQKINLYDEELSKS